MKKIALILASPPGVNPGMLICDTIGIKFIENIGLLKDTTVFRLSALPASLETNVVSSELVEKPLYSIFSHEILDDHRQLEGYIPLFWADFLHMALYLRVRASQLGQSFEDMSKLLLLSEVPAHILQSSFSFGTSCLFNSTADYACPKYREAFTHFVQGVHHIQMRDAVSAAVVSGIRRQGEDCFGVDVAQLLSMPVYESCLLGKGASGDLVLGRTPTALYFFARAKHDHSARDEFLRLLSDSFGVSATWLPWGDRQSFPFLEESCLPATADCLPESKDPLDFVANMLQHIKKAKIVVTDTYHVAACSWALGTPAVLLPGHYHDGEIMPKQLDVRVRHDKRKIIFSQDGLLDYFIEPHLLGNSASMLQIIGRLTESLADESLAARTRQDLATRCEYSTDRLRESILGQLQRS